MKTILWKIIFICILVSSLFSQTPEPLKVNLIKKMDTAPAILNLKIQLSAEINKAVFIELPAGLKPVIQSAKIGDKSLWLINDKKVIEKDNVLGWYKKGNGLVIHYNESIGNYNGLLEIELIPDGSRLQRFDTIDVKIYPVSNAGFGFAVQKPVLSQSIISVKKVDNE